MSHIAFLNIPGHGHVNPTLPVVAELVARGHRVTYAVPAGFAPQVAHAGAEPVAYRTVLPAEEGDWPMDAAGAMGLFLAEARQVLPQLAQSYVDDQPDLVVYDIGAWTARVLARRWGVPAIQFSPTHVAYEGWEEDMGVNPDEPAIAAFYAELAEWLREQDVEVPAPAFVSDPDSAVVSIPRAFQFRGDRVHPKYTFVGPCLDDRSHQGGWAPPDDRPVLLVSLGSAYTDRPEFYRRCLEAARGLDWHVVIAIGRHVSEEDLGDVPPNVELRAWVPQLAILAHATVFVTHCGMGGTMEGLHHGVPMIGVPTLGEQVMNAERLVELGVGRHLPHDRVTAAGLREAVLELAADRDVAARLAALRADIRAAGGTRAAADVVEAALR
ncbi:macrolide family glycosyltransferase [Actinosynnema sp. NPDC020468]|uniref:macrolide family glycosyltransferase n=1 Tax=Actinosynnema sp. NPDC020468 TaxID=3154488 RepID=UPI0033F68FA5